MTGKQLAQFITDFKEKNQFIPSGERDYTPVFAAQAAFGEQFEEKRREVRERLKLK